MTNYFHAFVPDSFGHLVTESTSQAGEIATKKKLKQKHARDSAIQGLISCLGDFIIVEIHPIGIQPMRI